jgi:hypothetical protein
LALVDAEAQAEGGGEAVPTGLGSDNYERRFLRRN